MILKFLVLLASPVATAVCCLFMPAMTQAQTFTEFVPLDPCRIFDTRKTTAMAAGETRNFFAFEIELGDIGGQGGQEGGCNIPTDAVAIQINFTTVNAAGTGFMRAWAWGSDQPNATVMNYFTENISNSIAIGICANICLFELSIKTLNSATDLVGDVVGFYRPVSDLLKGAIDEERALQPAALDRP